jgi:hypothetical protein
MLPTSSPKQTGTAGLDLPIWNYREEKESSTAYATFLPYTGKIIHKHCNFRKYRPVPEFHHCLLLQNQGRNGCAVGCAHFSYYQTQHWDVHKLKKKIQQKKRPL